MMVLDEKRGIGSKYCWITLPFGYRLFECQRRMREK